MSEPVKKESGLSIAFPKENVLLNKYVTSRSGSSIRLLVFSDSAVFYKVSTVIRNYGGNAQPAIKVSRILSHSATAWNNYIPAFLTVI